MISTGQARDNFTDMINRAHYNKERIIVSRRGKPVAAIVPIEDVEALEELEDRFDAEEVRKRLENPEPVIDWEDFKRQLHEED